MNTTDTPKLSEDFKRNLQRILPEEAKELIRAIEEDPAPTSIRFNKRKGKDLANRLVSEAVPYCPLGRYLEDRPSFTADPLFHGGVYYVQEASSMSLYCIKDLLGSSPLTALDLCASPGGKSTLLADILPEGSVLVSNEVVKTRANVLRENMQKWGSVASIVTSSYPESWEKLGALFDLVLVDAPCSGEGMFRKDIDSRGEWTKDSPRACAERQRDIVASAFKVLKEGGIMVYSTCTYNKEENEDILSFIIEELGAESLTLGAESLEEKQSTLSKYNAYRFMPHQSKGEGLFLSVVRKVAKQEVKEVSKVKASKIITTVGKDVGAVCCSWLKGEYIIHQDKNNEVWAMTGKVADVFAHLVKAKINIISKGIEVATIKGRDVIPAVALVLSSAFDTSCKSFGFVELSWQEALRYLRGETLSLEASVPRGFVVVTYQNIPLGLVKNLGTRANNLYPQYWRIQKPLERLLEEVPLPLLQ